MPTDNGPTRDVSPAKTPKHTKPKPESYNEAMNPPNSPHRKEDADYLSEYWDKYDSYHDTEDH
jgi:hypothetical protein